MRSLMRPADYFSDEVFERELNSIFKSLWILAAIKPMLSTDGAFRTTSLAGTPIALRNCGGTIRAFLNVCRHRGARLHQQEFGSGPLTCPYHGWSYDNDLKLDGLPRNKTLFQFGTEELNEKRLVEFSVREVGGLVFVNLSPNPLPIEQQFDPSLLEVLAASTLQIDDQFVYARYACDFNWKLGIENIKDPLHVEVLHKETFPEMFDTRADRANIAPMDHHVDPAKDWRPVSLPGVSDVWDVPMSGDSREWHDLVHRLEGKDVYRGIHLFPNVNLMIVAGAIFSVQTYNPLSADKTELQMLAATTRPIADFSYKPLVLWEHIKSDMTVLREDIECLEALQSGMRATPFEFEHGAYESSIVDFHQVCKQLRAAQPAKQP